MNIGKHLALAGLIGTFAVGMAQAQVQRDDAGPSRAAPPSERQPTAQPAPRTPSTSDRSTGAASSHDGAASAHRADAIVVDSSGQDPATFVKKAGLGGMTEVELGKIAQTMAKDPKVRTFADDMIKDHSKGNTELATLAKTKGLAVPTALDSEHSAIVQKLSGKNGSDFDAAYAKQMMEDHNKTIALFEGAAKSSDKDVAAFAERMLPTLEKHKKMADALPATSY